MNPELTAYILRFLLGDTFPESYYKLICYAAPTDHASSENSRYRLIIRPSKFFDTEVYGHEESLPKLPLTEWEGIPLLFGRNHEVYFPETNTLILYADIVASTYFLISRYEEILKRDIRDIHGRFPAKESLPVRAGFIHRPIIEEYGVALRSKLRGLGLDIPEPPKQFAQINLTHDIDQAFEYRGYRGFARAIIKELKSPIKAFRLAYSKYSDDPYYTFNDFLGWNKQVQEAMPDRADTIFFFKTPSSHPLDLPNYSLKRPPHSSIRKMAVKAGVVFGLHCSYASSLHPELIEQQRERLQADLQTPIYLSRHHYLAAREPEDMLMLLNAGIEHDYTMGYAEHAGFRLGTCRPVRFILPCTRRLTGLILHPLTVMDVSLNRVKYMGLNYETALKYCVGLMRATCRYNGELSLLWHNDNLTDRTHPWLAKLYRNLLKEIPRIEAEMQSGNDLRAVQGEDTSNVNTQNLSHS